MLTLASGLTDTDLAAITDLERRVVAHDGGRLKLEHGVLQERSGTQVDDLLWWEGGQLLGFVGIYAFGPPDVELAGMVDPGARRRGIATALLAPALALGRERGYAKALLVCSPAGQPFAQAQGATRAHSEHFLVLGQTPPGTAKDPDVTVRPAVLEDLPEVRRLLTAAFDWDPGDLSRHAASTTDTTLVIERRGAAVGTIRVSRHEGTGAVYGFAVDPAHQGKGIGRDVLARLCRQLRDEGYERVTLEVETENDSALGLYTSTGFVRRATEDYWALPL